MADVQTENGYTRIANELLEAITRYKFNGTQLKIVMAVIRYTYGFSRKDAELSLVYLSNATGVDKRNLRREINILISDKVLTVTKEATFTQSRMFRINKDYEEWKLNDPQWENIPTGGEITLPTEGELTHSPEGEITHSPGGELTPQERKINKDLKKDIKKDDLYDKIKDMFNSIAVDLPKVKALSEARKKAINARVKEHGIDLVREAFMTAQASDFLCGRGGDKWKASFDWIMNPNNFIKVIEGNYSRNGNGKKETKASGFINGIGNVLTNNGGLDDDKERNSINVNENQRLLSEFPEWNERK